jgi:4-amino-4-deoxy-L-arabinose transferase-like glycosyltransferase
MIMNAFKAHQRILLLLISLCYCILTILYAVLTPPWEAPDEPAHYMYVSQLAARWRPPLDSGIRQQESFSKDYPYISSNYEWYQPALGYLPDAVVYKALETIAPQSLPMNIPPLNPLFGTDPFKYSNLFSHADLRLFQVWDRDWGLLVIRILSSFWGLVIIYVAYKIGALLDEENGFLGIVAAGWVAILPQFTFINASIRSDTLTNAIAALVFLAAARMQSNTVDRNRSALLLGILLGLGLLSKYTFIYIVPVGLLAVVLAQPRHPRGWVQPLLCLILPMLILVGAYYLVFPEARAALEYALTTTQIKSELLTWRYLKTIPDPLLLDLFYARFGWANIIVPNTWPRLAFGIWALGAGVTAIQFGREIKKAERRDSIKIITLFGLGILLALVGVVRFNLSVYQPQGRLLFPALLPWSVLGFWGAWQFLPERGEKIATFLVIGFMLLFNVYALFFVLAPAYWR